MCAYVEGPRDEIGVRVQQLHGRFRSVPIGRIGEVETERAPDQVHGASRWQRFVHGVCSPSRLLRSTLTRYIGIDRLASSRYTLTIEQHFDGWRQEPDSPGAQTMIDPLHRLNRDELLESLRSGWGALLAR